LSEPKARASKVNYVYPWLLHFSIRDERIGDFRGDSYAIKSNDGLVVIDPVRLEDDIVQNVADAKYVVLTLGGHQRSSWRYRKEFGATVYAPVGSDELDEEPDHWYKEGDLLPAGIKPIKGHWFENSCHLLYKHNDDIAALFCGDIITQSEGGPYRFPRGKNMPDIEIAREEVRMLLELSADTLCPAHANPTADGYQVALQSALDYAY